jgi:hypothetical protein
MKLINFLHAFAGYLPAIGIVILGIVVLVGIARFVLFTINWRRLLRRKLVYLELTPPAFTVKSANATKQLFMVLSGLRASRVWQDKLLRREVVLSLEIVSSRDKGIRYLVAVETQLVDTIQNTITAYLPGSKVGVIDEPALPATRGTVVEYKQTGHYAFPLASHIFLDEHDPMAYLTEVMTKLDDGEDMRLQLIVSPAHVKDSADLVRQALNNEDLLMHLSRKHASPFPKIAYGINTVGFGVLDAVATVTSPSTLTSKSSGYGSSSSQRQAYDRLQVYKRQKPARQLSNFEQEVIGSVYAKVSEPLFRISIRAYVAMNSEAETKERISAISSSLESYAVPSYQSLKRKARLPYTGRYRRFAYKRKLPNLVHGSSNILSASEIASLYHFPIQETTRTDNLITSLSHTLPAPVSLKSGRKLAVMIGDNHHHNTVTPIGLTEPERERHLYIIGGTGNGKTTMLFYSILQDIRAGHGIAVLDPHGDLADRILRYIPENRMEDVIYMNPDDLTYPIGMNLLELPEGLTGDDLLREKDLITEATISVLRKIFSEDDSGGHRIEYVLRNSIQTALTLENPTLFTIFELLNDAKYRRKVVKTLTDKNLKDFWDNELGKAGEFQRVKMAAGITAKIGRFLFSASARRVLEQPKSTINFEDMLASKKILICNFSKGMLGEDTSTLFGTTVLAKIQTAALRRARIGEQNRVPFYLYVDEFQNFATVSFVQMLSEARKYKLFLTMAEQSTSQQDQQRLVDIILANVGTIVCFRSGSPADERLVLPLFSPFINQGEIANLPAYSYYVRIAAIDAQEPMSGVTIVVEDKGSGTIAKRVIESSRLLYAKKVAEEPEVDKVKAPTKPKATRSATKQSSPKQSGGLKAESSIK